MTILLSIIIIVKKKNDKKEIENYIYVLKKSEKRMGETYNILKGKESTTKKTINSYIRQTCCSHILPSPAS